MEVEGRQARVMPNCRAIAVGAFGNPPNPVVDGVFLQELKANPEGEANILGLYATLVGKKESMRAEAILTGDAFAPFVTECAGKTWGVDLRKKRYKMPFAIRLDRFVHELHPRTMQARSFESFVTQVTNSKGSGSVERQVHIYMNQPLRHEGLVLFQSGWGPQESEPANGRYYSVFAVVRNPSDQWPLWSCVVIALGLLVHFGYKLILYIEAERQKNRKVMEAVA